MNPTYISLFILFFLPFIISRSKRKKIVQYYMKNKHKNKENIIMTEFVKQFVGEECLIYLFDTQTQGTIKEVSETDNAILVENGNNTEIINLEFVTRIRKFPVNKKGKKKNLVID